MAAGTSGAPMAHPDQDLQPVPTLGPEDHRKPGTRIKLQRALHQQRQSVRRENGPPDRFLIRLTGRTGSLAAALRSGSATAVRQRSWQSSQRTHQSVMMFDGNIIPLWIPGGRVILAENRRPLFLITL